MKRLLVLAIFATIGCSSATQPERPGEVRRVEAPILGSWVAATKPVGEEQHEITLEFRPNGTYRTSNRGATGSDPSVTEGKWTSSPDGSIVLTPPDSYAGSARLVGDRLVVTFGPDEIEFTRRSKAG